MTDLRQRMLAIVNKWPHTPAGAIADAAIALVLEEAANAVAYLRWQEVDPFDGRTLGHAAATIRAMK